MSSQSRSPVTNIVVKSKQTLRAITSAPANNRSTPVETPHRSLDVNRNQEIGFFTDFSPYGQEEPLALEINMRNLENLTLLDNLNSVNGINGIENNENLAFFQDYDGQCNPPFLPDDDSKEPNVSRTVRVPTSEHVAEIVGRQGCKIKDLRARTNTYIKTPMRTEPPVFVVTGKETAVNLVISEINSAAEHFTQIRASRNHHKNGGVGGGGEVIKPVTREGDVVLHVTVPYRVVGLVVGLKGQTIKQIQQDTDTFIVTPNRDKAPIFEIRGQPSNVERARIMIQRHIEVRTRNCRLQDTTNLQNCDESRFGGSNDYHCSYTESSSPPDGNANHLSNNYINNGNSYNSLHSPNYSNNSSPPSTTNNYNSWRSYSGLLENSTSSQNAPIQTWSSATSEYNNVGNGHSSTSMGNNNMRGMQYSNMSVGSMSSNGSVSASQPQGFPSSGSFSNNRQLQGHMGGSNGSNSRLNEVDANGDGSSFSGFPLFSTSSNTPPKGSLVLSNIIQQSSPTNGSPVVGSRDMTNGGNGFGSVRNGNDIMGFSATTSADYYRGGFAGDYSMFGQMATSSDGNGFPSGESSPASKSCSLSESSGSQGSPTPRMCKVCEEADVVAALVPCGHNHFCMECAESIVNKSADMDRKCPICSAAASDVLRILA